MPREVAEARDMLVRAEKTLDLARAQSRIRGDAVADCWSSLENAAAAVFAVYKGVYDIKPEKSTEGGSFALADRIESLPDVGEMVFSEDDPPWIPRLAEIASTMSDTNDSQFALALAEEALDIAQRVVEWCENNEDYSVDDQDLDDDTVP